MAGKFYWGDVFPRFDSCMNIFILKKKERKKKLPLGTTGSGVFSEKEGVWPDLVTPLIYIRKILGNFISNLLTFSCNFVCKLMANFGSSAFIPFTNSSKKFQNFKWKKKKLRSNNFESSLKSRHPSVTHFLKKLKILRNVFLKEKKKN